MTETINAMNEDYITIFKQNNQYKWMHDHYDVRNEVDKDDVLATFLLDWSDYYNKFRLVVETLREDTQVSDGDKTYTKLDTVIRDVQKFTFTAEDFTKSFEIKKKEKNN